MEQQNKKNIFSKLTEKVKATASKVCKAISNFYEDEVQPILNKISDFVDNKLGMKKLKHKYYLLSNKTKKAIAGYIFILPFIIGLVIFGGQPILRSIRMALADEYASKMIDEISVYIAKGWGFEQFKMIFSENPDHLEAITAVLVDVLIVVPLVLIFSLILSLLLNRKLKGVKVFRMIFFIPVILLSGNLINYFNNYNLLQVPGIEGGTVESVLQFYLPEQVSSVILQAFSVVILILWLSGVQTLIFLAGLQKTNKPVYEAASIDGATKWESFWKITFPSLIPLMIINIVYTTVIYSNLGNELTALINTTSKNIHYGYDYASALSWILFMIEIVVIGVYTSILLLANKHYD